MMGAMCGGIWLMIVLRLALVLGFAYIIWVMASKEANSTKLIGKLLAVVIVALAVALFIGGLYAAKTKAGMCDGKGTMMNKGMMMDKGMMQQKMK